MEMVVDFPAPLGPNNPKTSPCWTEKLTPSTATVFPNSFRRSQSSRKSMSVPPGVE